MSLSTGQVNDAFKQATGRDPTGGELSTYTGRSDLEGSSGQQKLISELRGSGQFGSIGDVGKYLNNTVDSIYNGKVSSTEDILSSLRSSGQLPNTPAPTAPNLTQQYKDLAGQAGLDRIQTDINDLKGQQDDLAAQLRINVAAERGKPVATNVIEGRVGEQQRNIQEQSDFVGRTLSRKVDEYQAALGNIKFIMDLTQKDFDNASQSYTQQFQQAISTINLVQGIQQEQKNDVQKGIDNARANLQIFTNSITSGNLKYADLPADQRAQINKLEVQAGLPIGFTSSLKEKIDPKANIISTSENNGQIQVLLRNADGSMSLQKYGTANTGSNAKAGTSEAFSNALGEMSKKVTGKLNSYGDISPKDWQSALSAWLGAGFKRDDFIKNFGQYADTNRGDFQSAYGFANPRG